MNLDELSVIDMYNHLITRMTDHIPLPESLIHSSEYPAFVFNTQLEKHRVYTKRPYFGNIDGRNVTTALLSFSPDSFENILGLRMISKRKNSAKNFVEMGYIGFRKLQDPNLDIGMNFIHEKKDGTLEPYMVNVVRPITEEMLYDVEIKLANWQRKAPLDMINDLDTLINFFYGCIFDEKMITMRE